MTTGLRVLAEADLGTLLERVLAVLARVGVRVDTPRGRRILAGAGANVDEATGVVRFPRDLVEAALRRAPRTVVLGGRRPGWSLALDGTGCALVGDGEAIHATDHRGAERRPATEADWLAATHLLDALDEVGVYWRMVTAGLAEETPAGAVGHWSGAFAQFSKHVQDGAADVVQARWLLEVLSAVFGSREEVRRRRPFSFLLCPFSPLVLEGPYTDAYLETVGWDIPVAVMPMPLMGLSSPGSLAATIVQGTAEVLAMLCLVQAASPGTPVIFAPALAVMDPRSGRWAGGAVEHALLGAGTTEMARYLGLPVEASVGGSDPQVPGIQAAYERAINWTLPTLAWPDLLVGPGLIGGSMVLSLEQLVIDVEVFRRCARLRRGIGPVEADPAADEIAAVGHAGDYLARRATRDAIRSGEWMADRLGFHDTYERWVEAGRPDILDEAHERVAAILAAHRPLDLDGEIVRELGRLEARARAEGPVRSSSQG